MSLLLRPLLEDVGSYLRVFGRFASRRSPYKDTHRYRRGGSSGGRLLTNSQERRQRANEFRGNGCEFNLLCFNPYRLRLNDRLTVRLVYRVRVVLRPFSLHRDALGSGPLINVRMVNVVLLNCVVLLLTFLVRLFRVDAVLLNFKSPMHYSVLLGLRRCHIYGNNHGRQILRDRHRYNSTNFLVRVDDGHLARNFRFLHLVFYRIREVRPIPFFLFLVKRREFRPTCDHPKRSRGDAPPQDFLLVRVDCGDDVRLAIRHDSVYVGRFRGREDEHCCVQRGECIRHVHLATRARTSSPRRNDRSQRTPPSTFAKFKERYRFRHVLLKGARDSGRPCGDACSNGLRRRLSNDPRLASVLRRVGFRLLIFP